LADVLVQPPNPKAKTNATIVNLLVTVSPYL
jgi:hypothetical protein